MVDFFFSTTKVRNPPGILRIILTICLLLADFVRNDAANLMLSKCQPPADAIVKRPLKECAAIHLTTEHKLRSVTTKCSGRWCSTSHEVACGAVRHQHSPQHCNLEEVRSLVKNSDLWLCLVEELQQRQYSAFHSCRNILVTFATPYSHTS